RRLRAALLRLSRGRPVLFPVPPRPRKLLAAACWPLDGPGYLRLIDPVGYVEMLGLVAGAALVITDSGGLQEETTYLGVPCLTVRPNTERPITCTNGTNRLVPPRGATIIAAAERAVARRPPVRPVIERWDGRAAERIARVLCEDERYGLDDVVVAGPRAARLARVPAPIARLSAVSRTRRSAILAPRLLERPVRVAPSPLATPRGAWVCSNATSGSGRALRRSPWRPSPAPTRRLHTARPHAPASGVAEVRRPAFV